MNKFILTLENAQGTVLETLSFDTKKEANKAKRELAKIHGLVSHAGHLVNYTQHDETKVFELFTNY